MNVSLLRPSSLGMMALLLAGCAGGATPSLAPSSSLLAPSGLSPNNNQGTARIVVHIPKPQRPAHYISPSTQSMTVAIFHGTTQVYAHTFNLLPTSAGCKTVPTGTKCKLNIQLVAGNYNASIATFDAANGAGKRLSQGQGLTFGVVKGKIKTIPLALNGIVAHLLILNAGPDAVYVVALDAGGNYIIGPGSPTYVAARVSGTPVAVITQPTATRPNIVSFAPAGIAPGQETIGITASFPSGINGCAPTGRACTGFVSASYGQTLFVTNYQNKNVLGFSLPLTSNAQAAAYVLPAYYPLVLALDASDDLFVGGYGQPGHLYEFKPPYPTTPSVTNATGINDPYGLAVDSSGAVYSANTKAPGTVSIFNSPYTAAPTVISNGVSFPFATAVDASKNLYVANEGNNTVTVYPPPYTTASPVSVATVSTPYSILVAGTKLYVGEVSAIEVFDITAPLTHASTPAVTLTNGISYVYSMAFDASGNLFASNLLGGVSFFYGTITKYAAPLTNGEAPAITLTQTKAGVSTYSPWGIAFDAAGNLYVVNTVGGVGAGGIVEYLAPITAASTPTYSVATNQFNSPNNLAITKAKSLTITP